MIAGTNYLLQVLSQGELDGVKRTGDVHYQARYRSLFVKKAMPLLAGKRRLFQSAKGDFVIIVVTIYERHKFCSSWQKMVAPTAPISNLNDEHNIQISHELTIFSTNYDDKQCISDSQTILLTFTFIYYTWLIMGKNGRVFKRFLG